MKTLFAWGLVLAITGVGTASAQNEGGLAQSATNSEASEQPSLYVVDGLALGESVHFGSAAYRAYKCSPSEKFDGFTWCQRDQQEGRGKRRVYSSNSILHTTDGRTSYINKYIRPAFLTESDAKKEIARISKKYGESTRVETLPAKAGRPQAIITIWGQVELVEIDQEAKSILAKGESPEVGLLVDFLGDFHKSAKMGLPVYRLSGGAGYVWNASFDRKGVGHLRLSAVDASALSGETRTAGFEGPAKSAGPEKIEEPATAPEQNVGRFLNEKESGKSSADIIAENQRQFEAVKKLKDKETANTADQPQVATPSEQVQSRQPPTEPDAADSAPGDGPQLPPEQAQARWHPKPGEIIVLSVETEINMNGDAALWQSKDARVEGWRLVAEGVHRTAPNKFLSLISCAVPTGTKAEIISYDSEARNGLGLSTVRVSEGQHNGCTGIVTSEQMSLASGTNQVGAGSTSPRADEKQPAQTPPVQAQVETLVAEFSGKGIHSTRPFTVKGPWEIQWSSDSAYLAIFLKKPDEPDGSDLIANQQGSGTGSSYQPQGGTYYLETNGIGGWHIKVVEISDDTGGDNRPGTGPGSATPSEQVEAPQPPTEPPQPPVATPSEQAQAPQPPAEPAQAKDEAGTAVGAKGKSSAEIIAESQRQVEAVKPKEKTANTEPDQPQVATPSEQAQAPQPPAEPAQAKDEAGTAVDTAKPDRAIAAPIQPDRVCPGEARETNGPKSIVNSILIKDEENHRIKDLGVDVSGTKLRVIYVVTGSYYLTEYFTDGSSFPGKSWLQSLIPESAREYMRGATPLLFSAKDLFQTLFEKCPSITEVEVVARGSFIDKRGHESVEDAVKLAFTRDNASTVVWDKVYPRDVPELADRYWTHPGIQSGE